jgi:hypothetical protein
VTGGVRYLRLYAPLVASGQSITTVENTPVAVTLAGSDPAGSPVTEPVYTPAADYNGPDSFAFVAGDGK